MKMHSRRGFLKQSLLAAGMSAAPWLDTLRAQTTSSAVQEKLDSLQKMSGAERANFLRKEAEKEGKVVMYASDDPNLLRAWQTEFKKDFPSIDAQFVRTTSADLLTRAVNESRTGRPAVDILHPPAVQLAVLQRMNLVAKYRTPESKSIPPEFIDPNGYWTAFWLAPSVIAYNTQLIKKEDVPKTLDQLADSTLGNRLARNSVAAGWIGGLFSALGEGPATELLKKLAAQKPRLYDSNSALMAGLSSGQIVVGYDVNLSNVIIAKKQGAPVDYIIIEPLIVQPVYQVIMNEAPHPFAAALAYDWILSDRGQIPYEPLGQLGPRSDIDYPGAEVIKNAKKPPTYLSATLLSDPDRFSKLFEDLFIRRTP